MVCWPATIVGAITVAIIIFNMIEGEWMDVAYQGGIGALGTLFFWILCYFFGEQISFGVFIVPAIMFLTFLLASWLITKRLNDRGCCVKCNGQAPKPEPSPTPDIPEICPPALSATSNM
jgi:hypothetical protein